MKVLVSALATSPHLGSEALVGFRVLQALSRQFAVEAVTSAAMEGPEGVKTYKVPVRFDDPNDVAMSQLLRFEFYQRFVVSRLQRARSFGVVHRLTPSGHKESLIAVPSVPLVLGPILGSDPAPESFQPIFRPRLSSSYSPRAIVARIGHGVARRILRRFSTLESLIENATLILVGTELTRRRLPTRLQSRCRLVTYCGVEHDEFTPPVKRTEAAVPELLFVGRLVPYKGLELLLRAAGVARRRCRFHLRIVGGGSRAYREYCETLAERLGLADTVTFVGHTPRASLPVLYQRASIFCMPSIETYGIAILEAMSSGCAVLTSDFNGPGEIVQAGMGLKVPLCDPDQFVRDYAERMYELVDDGRLRSELGERARQHVMIHHDWNTIQAQLLAIYDEFIPRVERQAV